METNISNTTTTDMKTNVTDYSVASVSPDAATGAQETEYLNANADIWLGYYKKIPELKKAIDTFATWVLGRGYETDAETQVTLDHITGWGEDCFLSILWNLIVCKKIYGDAFAEIIKDTETGDLINLKVLDPAAIKTIVNEKGIVKRYEQFSKAPSVRGKILRTFKPEELLHLCNDRVADEIHGTSVIEACEWVILARNEAMSDWKRISHRATIRVLYVDVDNITKLTELRKQYENAIKNGEVLILPGKPSEAGFQDLNLPPYDAFLQWIKYLENFFYQSVGVPKTISGGTQDNTEASAKVGMAVFDPIYIREITELQKDLFNQLYMEVEFIEQPSIMNEMQKSETKQPNYATGFQKSEMIPGKNE